ncbi:hypothetical protein [Nostoc sp.]|uniref:hypothetical protein n=1 Tax=Nostoc sp. TaxID=1180 RepID=UPI003FA59368
MSVAKDFKLPKDVIFPPGDLESNEPPLETYLHLQQMLLLIKCLDWWWRDHNAYSKPRLGATRKSEILVK